MTQILPKAGLWFPNLPRAQTLLPKTVEMWTAFSQKCCPWTQGLEMHCPDHSVGSRISAKRKSEILESWKYSLLASLNSSKAWHSSLGIFLTHVCSSEAGTASGTVEVLKYFCNSNIFRGLPGPVSANSGSNKQGTASKKIFREFLFLFVFLRKPERGAS